MNHSFINDTIPNNNVQSSFVLRGDNFVNDNLLNNNSQNPNFNRGNVNPAFLNRNNPNIYNHFKLLNRGIPSSANRNDMNDFFTDVMQNNREQESSKFMIHPGAKEQNQNIVNHQFATSQNVKTSEFHPLNLTFNNYKK